jgi:hypothetical protein
MKTQKKLIAEQDQMDCYRIKIIFKITLLSLISPGCNVTPSLRRIESSFVRIDQVRIQDDNVYLRMGTDALQEGDFHFNSQDYGIIGILRSIDTSTTHLAVFAIRKPIWYCSL